MDSFDTNYIFTNNKKILANMTKMQYRPRQCHATAILYWVNMLTSSSGTNYVPNEHEDFSQYGPYVILSEVLPCYRYPANLLDQF